MDTWLVRLSAESGVLGASAAHIAPRLLMATALGSLLAWRPWQRRARPKPEIVHTQLLMCVAAALIATVIGDSLARAFGVVGLGGFIRFRTPLKDPRDAASLFLLIGVGMSAGLALYELAAAGAVMVALLLAGLELLPRRGRGVERVRLLVEAEPPQRIEPAFAAALGRDGYRAISARVEPGTNRAWLEVEGPEGLAAAWDKRGKKVGRLLAWERAGAEPGPAVVGGGKVA
jgi:hypothetical protein